MTKEEVEKYEYCKAHIGFVEGCKKGLTFGVQKYGCGSGRPNIEYMLEEVHRKMYEKVIEAMNEARDEAQKIINAI